MAYLAISEVARRLGMRASAIRYYEQEGILAPAHRVGGQRQYDTSVLYRLAVIQRARHLGFTLDEIRGLFFGFVEDTPAAERWGRLAQRKIAELDKRAEEIQTMRAALQRLATHCRCAVLEECGRGMLASTCVPVPLPVRAGSLRPHAGRRRY